MNTKLRQALAAAGLSQSELARRLGIHQSHVNRWLSGKLLPTLEQLTSTMALLEVDSPIALGYRIEPRSVIVVD